MSRCRIAGVVIGVSGAIISVFHITILIVTREKEPLHGFWAWVMSGLILTFIGILLMGSGKKR